MSTTFTNAGVTLFRLMAVRAAIRMEAAGMTSRGGSVRKAWAVELGLKHNAKAPVVLAALEARIEATKAAVQQGDIITG